MDRYLVLLACCAICARLGFMAGCHWTEAKQDGIGDADEYKVGGSSSDDDYDGPG